MICYQVWLLLLLLHLCIADFNFGDPKKFLICFFQEMKVFKCQDNSIKDTVKLYYYSTKTRLLTDMDTNSKCPNPDKPIKIIIHGWGGSANNSWFADMNENYKKNGIEDVFAVDWSKHARNPNYFQSAADAKCVGDAVGEFIVNYLLKKCNIDLDDLHLIGHSLGAHISGFAGKFVQQNINTNIDKISRISGLDPAGPYFWKCDPQYRLDKGDAHIVDVIHTDEFKFGCVEPMGNFDFYVNGGHAPQPGCFLTRKKRDTFPGVTCSHSRATALYAASITTDGFISKKCANEIMYNLGQCNANTALIMGEFLNGTLDNSGIYHLQTTAQFPFAKFGQISIL